MSQPEKLRVAVLRCEHGDGCYGRYGHVTLNGVESKRATKEHAERMEYALSQPGVPNV